VSWLDQEELRASKATTPFKALFLNYSVAPERVTISLYAVWCAFLAAYMLYLANVLSSANDSSPVWT